MKLCQYFKKCTLHILHRGDDNTCRFCLYVKTGFQILSKNMLFSRLGSDGLKHESGDSEDDYNDADWSLYPDKKSGFDLYVIVLECYLPVFFL